jgi:ABC transporter substrate binding protein
MGGGLISYGPNLDEMFRRMTFYVDRILKGTKPTDIPIERPTRFELVVNVKTAKELGLDLPPALLARAAAHQSTALTGRARTTLRQPDGIMRVTSGSWDGEKVILRDQVLEFEMSTAVCTPRASRASTTSGTRMSRPTIRMAAGLSVSAYAGDEAIDD